VPAGGAPNLGLSLRACRSEDAPLGLVSGRALYMGRWLAPLTTKASGGALSGYALALVLLAHSAHSRGQQLLLRGLLDSWQGTGSSLLGSLGGSAASVDAGRRQQQQPPRPAWPGPAGCAGALP
jgi:hypothetical protein